MSRTRGEASLLTLPGLPSTFPPLVSDFIHRVARAQPEEGCDLSTIFLHSIANDDIEGGLSTRGRASGSEKLTFFHKNSTFFFRFDTSLNKVILINLILINLFPNN